MKVCTKCHAEKDVEDFYRVSRASDGRDSYCKVCRGTNSMKYYSEKTRRQAASRQYQYRYGITAAEKELLLVAQNKQCACCGTSDPGKRGWVVDHNHATGEKRGILCNSCNAALGFVQDSVQHLEKLSAYLMADRKIGVSVAVTI